MVFSELFEKITTRFPGQDDKDMLLFGRKDWNSNRIELHITDSVLENIDDEVHLHEDPYILERYKDHISHIIFHGSDDQKNLELLDRFISSVQWKRLRDLHITPARFTPIDYATPISTTYLCSEIKDLSKLKEHVLQYFIGHTMIWLDHNHVSPENYERGLISSLRQNRHFYKAPFSVRTKIQQKRQGSSVILFDEEFICSALRSRTSLNGTSVITGVSTAFTYKQVNFYLVIKPTENRTIFEPIYDTVIYYGKKLKEVNMDNLKRCQLLAKKRVIILLSDEKEREKLSQFKVLNVW